MNTSRLLLFVLAMGMGTALGQGRTTTSNLLDGDTPVLRGTINVIVGNANGIVVLTDSMVTEVSPAGERQLPDPAQKLFRLDDFTVCTIAGFGSASTPPAPEFLNSSAGIISEFSENMRAQRAKVSMIEKLRSLRGLFEFYLTGIANLREIGGLAGSYSLQLLIAGYDLDGKARIGGLIIDVSAHADHTLSARLRDGFLYDVGPNLVVTVAGQSDVAREILTHPATWAQDPAIAAYLSSKQRDSGQSFSLNDMRAFASSVARLTSARHATVGGPNQIAVLNAGTLKSVEQQRFPTPPRTPFKFGLVSANTFPGGAIDFGTSVITIYIRNSITGGTLELDHGFFFANKITNCKVHFDGGPVRFDQSNEVSNSALIIGTHAKRDSEEVKKMVREHAWKAVQYE